MSTSDDNDVVRDIVAPALLLLGMLIGNGVLLAIILRKRKRVVYEDISQYAPVVEPTSSAGANVAIEMEELKST